MASPVVVSRIQNRRGTQEQFNLLYPIGYTGIGGYGSLPDFTATNYPDVLLPGEIAFCTNSRRVFLGNINGEYIEIAQTGSSEENSIQLTPIAIQLAPIATFTHILELDYFARSFFTIYYDLSNNLNPNWISPGTSFSRSGTLQITSVAYVASPPPTTLTDSGTEINNVAGATISFIAEYDSSHLVTQIKYKHNFPGPLSFRTSSFTWAPF